MPRSGSRLAQLAADHRLMHANLRIIAMPFPGSPSAGPDNAPPNALVNPDVAKTYAMFASQREGAPPAHVELLVDGAGMVRSRWTDLPGSDGDRDAQIIAAVRRLPAPSRTAAMHHGH